MSILPTHVVEDFPNLTIKVGVKVIKDFGDDGGEGWYRGHVIDIDSDEDDGSVLYHIQYEDGDQEDMNETECRDAIFMYSQIGHLRGI